MLLCAFCVSRQVLCVLRLWMMLANLYQDLDMVPTGNFQWNWILMMASKSIFSVSPWHRTRTIWKREWIGQFYELDANWLRRIWMNAFTFKCWQFNFSFSKCAPSKTTAGQFEIRFQLGMLACPVREFCPTIRFLYFIFLQLYLFFMRNH